MDDENMNEELEGDATLLLPSEGGHHRLFKILDADEDGFVSGKDFFFALETAGIEPSDPRLGSCVHFITSKGGADAKLSFDDFDNALQQSSVLLDRVLNSQLIIPDMKEFGNKLTEIYTQTCGMQATVSPTHTPPPLAVSICTIDGQRSNFGCSDIEFPIEQCAFPLSFALAVEEFGLETVMSKVAVERTMEKKDQRDLCSDGRPRHPLLTVGAIMIAGMLRRGFSIRQRFETFVQTVSSLAADAPFEFDDKLYLSKQLKSDDIRFLGYLLRETKMFQSTSDVIDAVELFLRCCCVKGNAQSLSVVAATLANGGLCPYTGQRLFQPSTVKNCLTVMSCCGMQDFSSEWSFRVGVPAKSSTSGCIMVVIPNVLGMCVWSEQLDRHQNSAAGLNFLSQLFMKFTFEPYHMPVLLADPKQINPTRKQNKRRKHLDVIALLYAAAEGDLHEVKRLTAAGVNLNSTDYDGRTALHLASAEGHASIVHFLLSQGAKPDPIDRWGVTPQSQTA
eukprot:GILJ01009914.1.p1 GENE.GILJ01009914.1~~GILJ01009914.1.p1  ORF type:complete len:506 (+),score=62.92 GILJ01009914.1:17-1534(+)